jgi:hypothetical protein
MECERWRGKCGGVANLEFLTRLDQFATLATRLDFLGVSAFPLECHACHASHGEKTDNTENFSHNKACIDNQAGLQWLAIAIDEGHMEPSQPLIGRLTGWPKRMVALRSLWVDFTCWCSKMKIPKSEFPEQWMFYALLDQLFVRKNDKYEIPTLEKCRTTYHTLRCQHECD